MPKITCIQKRKPFSHSAASSADYVHRVDSDEFSIKRYKDDSIGIFFKRSSMHGQGIWLYLTSKDVATAFGHALLMVSEGYSNDVTISI